MRRSERPRAGESWSAPCRPPSRGLCLILATENALAGARGDDGPVVVAASRQVVDLVALARDVALDCAGGLCGRPGLRRG